MKHMKGVLGVCLVALLVLGPSVVYGEEAIIPSVLDDLGQGQAPDADDSGSAVSELEEVLDEGDEALGDEGPADDEGDLEDVAEDAGDIEEDADSSDESSICDGVNGDGEDGEEEDGLSISLFGYTVVIVLASDDTPASVGLCADNGEEGSEELATYTVGGIKGQAVSAVAQAVTPGVSHGKVVSAFVHEVNRIRKEARDETKAERKGTDDVDEGDEDADQGDNDAEADDDEATAESSKDKARGKGHDKKDLTTADQTDDDVAESDEEGSGSILPNGKQKKDNSGSHRGQGRPGR